VKQLDLDKQTEAKITKAVNKWAKTIEGDIGFAETRNIPQAVAEIYGKMFGFNPETLVDKKRNFQKTDARGLTKAKQFLIKNAQSDHARMVEVKNDMGKGTFVPNNVKNALFKDGKFTGTLKQYLDLINEKATKPIYRDRTAQTIKGLLALHIRNRMLETAQPVQGKRVQSGAKFAKSEIDNNSLLKTLDNNDIKGVMDTLGVAEGDSTVTAENRKKIQKSILKAVKAGKIPYDIFRRLGLSNFGADRSVDSNGNYIYKLDNGAEMMGTPTLDKNGKQKLDRKGNKIFTVPSKKAIELAFPGQNVKVAAERGSLFYGKGDQALIDIEKAAEKNNDFYTKEELNNFKAQRISIPEGTRINKNTKLRNGKTIAEQEKINMKALMSFIDMLEGMPMREAGILVRQSYAATTGLIKIAAPFIGVSERFIRAKGINPSTGKPWKQADRKQPYIEEHSPPASVVGAAILWGLKNGKLAEIKQGVKDNFIQVQLSNNADVKIDKAKLDKLLPKGVSILTPNAGLIRLAAAGINLNTIKDLNNPGKSLADKAGLPLPKELRSNPSAFNYQNRLLVDASTLKSDPKNEAKFLDETIMTLEKAKGNLKVSRPVQKLKQEAVDKGVKDFGDQIFSRTQDAQQRKDTMLNSFETRIRASRSNPKRKGISVFDFDDTLARTKERVIVKMIDGTTKEISAAAVC
jgi:hypothetical protein